LKDSEGKKCHTTQAICKQQQSLKKMNEAKTGSGDGMVLNTPLWFSP
jgi:hypothetical protein